jgi:hypothetical protein
MPIDNIPKTRKSLFGNKEITKSKYKNPKTKEVTKSRSVKYSDGSSKTKTVEKKPGLFAKKVTTRTYRGSGSNEDQVTVKRTRKKGVLPRVTTVTTDNMMEKKEVKRNPLYTLGYAKKTRKKLNTGVRGDGERVTPQNCLKGCSAGIKK